MAGPFVREVNAGPNTFLRCNEDGTITAQGHSYTLTLDGWGPGQVLTAPSFSITTLPGTVGNVPGGDYIVNLGSGSGTGRNGSLQIIGGTGGVGSTSGIAPLDLQQTYTQQSGTWIRPVLHINASYSAASADTTSPNPVFVQYVMSGAGDNMLGPQLAAAEFWLYPNTSGTLAPRIYALEGTIDTVSGTVTTAVAVQGNLRHNAAGTIVTGYGVVGTLGPANNAGGSVTNGIAVSAQMDTTSMAGTFGTVIGFDSQIVQATAAATDTTAHTLFGARLGIPSQGGNTSGIGVNYGLYVTNSAPVGAGGGTEGVGGQMQNYAIKLDLPNTTGSSPSSGHQNYGLYINGNGGATGTNISNFALFSTSTANSTLLGALEVGSNATISATSTFIVVSAPAAQAAGASTFWRGVSVKASTLSLTGNSACNLATGVNLVEIAQPTISGAGTAVVSFAASLAILGAPIAAGAGPATITNPYAFWVQAGATSLDGQTALGRAYHKMATNNGLLSTSSAQSITLTAAILVGGFLDHTVTTGAATDTLDTGTNISTAIPGASVGDSFIFTLNNSSASAFAITLASATGATLKGSTTTIAQNKTGILTFVNTGANTWNVYVTVSA